MVKWNWRKSCIIFPRENEHLVQFEFSPVSTFVDDFRTFVESVDIVPD